MVTRIKKTTLAPQVATSVLESILRGELKPGLKIEQAKLAAQFGVKPGPLREALPSLVDSGLIRKNRHTIAVAQQSEVDAEILLAVRHELEPRAAALAGQNLTPEDIRTLERHLGKMRTAIPRRDLTMFFAQDLVFHGYIWKMPRQDTLKRLFRLVLPPLYAFFFERFGRSILENPLQVEVALNRQVQVYDKLLEVLKTRDPIKIRKAFGKVLAMNWRTVTDWATKQASGKEPQSPAEPSPVHTFHAGSGS